MQYPTNKHYNQLQDVWRLARDFYELMDVQRYITKGKYEQSDPYKARQARASANPLTKQVISNISDQLLLRADEVERDLGPIAASYPANAGPNGEAHALQMKRLGDAILLYGEAWLQIYMAGGRPKLRVVHPIHVPRWTGDAVVTIGMRTVPSGPLENEQTEETLTVHTAEGYTTYVDQSEEGEEQMLVPVDSGQYLEGAFIVDSEGRPSPPFVRAVYPHGALGIEVARTHRAIYQLESEIDGRLRTALTAGQQVYNGLDKSGEESIVRAHKMGDNLIFLPDGAEQHPVEVPTESVEMAEARIKAKREALYNAVQMHMTEASAASSATETVARNEGAAAVTATLAGTVESAEDTALRIIAQMQDMITFAGPDPQEVPVSVSYAGIDWQASGIDLSQGANSEE